MSAELDRTFDVFGSRARLLVIPAADDAHRRVALLERHLRDMHHRLTRFHPDSELSRMNADPREVVPVSYQLERAVAAALRTARLSRGLVDPTLLPELVAAGYESSLAQRTPASLQRALAAAPRRRPAQPARPARWPQVVVSQGAVTRPLGLRLDLGGSAKGLAADLCAGLLAGQDAFAVDVGGDVHIGGTAGVQRMVEVEHPLTGAAAHRFALSAGAVATSGIGRRVWECRRGFAHHLIDPGTGEPAWTGVIQATALAPTALVAETLAKMALLSGPEHGLEILERHHGGVLVLDSGDVQVAGRDVLTTVAA
jgi:thiamine biosynthesis lipoprotein